MHWKTLSSRVNGSRPEWGVEVGVEGLLQAVAENMEYACGNVADSTAKVSLPYPSRHAPTFVLRGCLRPLRRTPYFVRAGPRTAMQRMR